MDNLDVLMCKFSTVYSWGFSYLLLLVRMHLLIECMRLNDSSKMSELLFFKFQIFSGTMPVGEINDKSPWAQIDYRILLKTN